MFDQYPHYEYLFARIQLVLFMLGMGATLKAADFAVIYKQPRSLIAGFAAQLLLAPLWAVLVNRLWSLEPGFAVGLILVAAMPGGNLSKAFVYLGRGNMALTIALSVLGTFAAIVTVPLLLELLVREYVPADFAMPVGWVVRDVALYLLLPLAVGMGLARGRPEMAPSIAKLCIRAGFAFVVLMVAGSLGSGRIHPSEHGLSVPIAIIVFCLLSMQTSMLPFRLLHWPKPDCLAVGMEVTMRNLNLALLLKALLFPAEERGVDAIADGVLFVILFYAGVALCCGAPMALRYRWMGRRRTVDAAIAQK